MSIIKVYYAISKSDPLKRKLEGTLTIIKKL